MGQKSGKKQTLCCHQRGAAEEWTGKKKGGVKFVDESNFLSLESFFFVLWSFWITGKDA